MRIKEYHIQRKPDGRVEVTPVAYGGKGRPIRLLWEMVVSENVKQAASRVAVTVNAMKDREG